MSARSSATSTDEGAGWLPGYSNGASGELSTILAMAAAGRTPTHAQTSSASGGSPAAQAAAAKPNVAAGAAVGDTQGGSVGTVASVDGQVATVTLAGGGKVRLPVSAFAAGSDGGLKIAMTAAQLKAAAGAAK